MLSKEWEIITIVCTVLGVLGCGLLYWTQKDKQRIREKCEMDARAGLYDEKVKAQNAAQQNDFVAIPLTEPASYYSAASVVQPQSNDSFLVEMSRSPDLVPPPAYSEPSSSRPNTPHLASPGPPRRVRQHSSRASSPVAPHHYYPQPGSAPTGQQPVVGRF